MTKAQRILEAKRAVSRGESARNEGQFQEAVAMLLDALGLLWTHPANERKCSPQRGAMLKRQGVKPGVPDVLIFQVTCKMEYSLYNSLRKYGISFNQESIEAYAMTNAIWDGVGAITAQERAMAILGMTHEGTADTQNDGVYYGCAIELKYGKNRVTSEQQHWLDALEEHGWYTAVARSMDEVISILERCGYLEAIR